MREVDRVNELNCLQRLVCDLSKVTDIKPFVLVVLDEVVEALTQGLEDQAHICQTLLRLRIYRSVRKPFLEIDDSTLAATMPLEISQDLRLGLCALRVSFNCPDYLYCVDLILIDFKALKGSSESAISEMPNNFILATTFFLRAQDHALKPDEMTSVFAPVD